MYTKSIAVPTDWLSEVDGKTVADAIVYLQTLDQSHTLNYSMEGDTHGCNVVSDLTYEVPMTNAEIFAMLEKRYMRDIKLFEEAKEKHTKDGRTERVEGCDRQLAQLREKLAAAKAKYCDPANT